ncbi:hypothetical protein [Pseudanabaena sp. PCC 6802]|uniref:hypothetical protein n=1 Tax=Pseudanabaena sp. PCC 6802 TaxID=118173 RepID=UPI000346A188|nr:hypothetical protein [Pseudanabaena sp. PCC 6802]
MCLILLAIAPIFLNSNLPIIGFAIWFAIPLMFGSSIIYIIRKIVDTIKTRDKFIGVFPEYSYLKITDFLGISSREMSQRLEAYMAIQDESDRDILNITPLDLLHQPQRK